MPKVAPAANRPRFVLPAVGAAPRPMRGAGTAILDPAELQALPSVPLSPVSIQGRAGYKIHLVVPI